MATRSKAELRDDVLRELNVLAAGQVASAEDAALVMDRIETVLDDLDDDSLVPWGVGNPIPGKAYLPLVSIVANTLVGAFGQQIRAGELSQNDTMARRRLRKQAALGYVSTVTQANYY